MNNINKKRVNNLYKYTIAIMNNENIRESYYKHEKDIKNVTPQEVMEIEFKQLNDGITPKRMLTYIDKLINVYYESLSKYKWIKPKDGTFLYYLIEENNQLKNKLDNIKKHIKGKKIHNNREILLSLIMELKGFDVHYLKKENILFPFMEKKMERYNGLKVMWTLHNMIRNTINNTITILKKDVLNNDKFVVLIGELFFKMHGLIQKEQLILFPIASEVISENEFDEMLNQSMNYEFAYVDKPVKIIGNKKTNSTLKDYNMYEFNSGTGILKFEQLLLLLNKLPLDITLIDEKDKVVYFNTPNERFFNRDKAIIGRDVKNCHPPKSVHIVEKILNSFKNGSRSEAKFWVEISNRTILITYYALKDANDSYKGTLEVTQNITNIKSITGEKRLLDWE